MLNSSIVSYRIIIIIIIFILWLGEMINCHFIQDCLQTLCQSQQLTCSSSLTKNVDRDGLNFKVSLTDDLSSTFIHAAVAWLDVVNS